MTQMTLESLRSFLDDMIGQYGGKTPLLMNLSPLDEEANNYTDLFQFNLKAVQDQEKNTYLALSLAAMTLTVSEEQTKQATTTPKKTTRKKTTKKKES